MEDEEQEAGIHPPSLRGLAERWSRTPGPRARDFAGNVKGSPPQTAPEPQFGPALSWFSPPSSSSLSSSSPFRPHQLTSPSPRYPSPLPPTPPSVLCAAVARPKAGPVATDGARAQCQGTESFSHGLANAYPLGANHGARDETNSTRPMLHRCVRHAPLPQARFFSRSTLVYIIWVSE